MEEDDDDLGAMITDDARCRREIKSRISIAKAAFNKKDGNASIAGTGQST